MSLEGDRGLGYRGARDWEGSGSEKGQLDRGLGWGRSLSVQESGRGQESGYVRDWEGSGS